MKKTITQFMGFGLVGAFNTVLGLVIYWVCVRLGVHYLIANAIGFMITVAISYILNNAITFRDNREVEWSLKTLIKVYISYSITGLFLNSILLWAWTEMAGVSENIAPVLNLCITIPTNFVLNKLWAYKR